MEERRRRTLYMLDVRTREEFERGHVAGSRHAPGGQLVQASDEYVGVRNARVVLVDPEQVRAVMTASWLTQMDWHEVYVLEDPGLGRKRPAPAANPRLAGMAGGDVIPEGATVLDLSTSLRFYHAHIPGAWWACVRGSRRPVQKKAELKKLVLTSEDSILAHLAAPEAAALFIPKCWCLKAAMRHGRARPNRAKSASPPSATMSGISRTTTLRTTRSTRAII